MELQLRKHLQLEDRQTYKSMTHTGLTVIQQNTLCPNVNVIYSDALALSYTSPWMLWLDRVLAGL